MSRSDMYYRELHPHTDPTFIQASKEVAEAIGPKLHEIADMAKRYAVLKDAAYLTSDGDVIEAKAYDKEVSDLNKILKAYIEEHGPVDVEGLPPLIVQTPTSYKVDLRSLAEHDPETFRRLLDLGCLQADMKALDAQEKAGNIAANGPRMPLAGSTRLLFDRR